MTHLLPHSTNNSIQAWKRCMSLAQRCTTMRQFKPIHAIFLTHGLHHNNYALSKLLSFCALSHTGSLSYASLIFTQMIQTPNSFIYNTLIRAYSRSSQPQLSLHYFHLMLKDCSNLVPDHHTVSFPSFGLRECQMGSRGQANSQLGSNI
jgi:pentatricopeptide repeat protein